MPPLVLIQIRSLSSTSNCPTPAFANPFFSEKLVNVPAFSLKRHSPPPVPIQSTPWRSWVIERITFDGRLDVSSARLENFSRSPVDRSYLISPPTEPIVGAPPIHNIRRLSSKMILTSASDKCCTESFSKSNLDIPPGPPKKRSPFSQETILWIKAIPRTAL